MENVNFYMNQRFLCVVKSDCYNSKFFIVLKLKYNKNLLCLSLDKGIMHVHVKFNKTNINQISSKLKKISF